MNRLQCSRSQSFQIVRDLLSDRRSLLYGSHGSRDFAQPAIDAEQDSGQ
jgi:hypothetical protein